MFYICLPTCEGPFYLKKSAVRRTIYRIDTIHGHNQLFILHIAQSRNTAVTRPNRTTVYWFTRTPTAMHFVRIVHADGLMPHLVFKPCVLAASFALRLLIILGAFGTTSFIQTRWFLKLILMAIICDMFLFLSGCNLSSRISDLVLSKILIS